jgi:hypothetical protein
MLQSRNFSPKFRTLIKSVLHKGSFCVRINDSNSSYFVAGKGLKQGDPLSPILFNYIADVFTKILYKAARNNLISGLLPSVVPGGVISLQYADDTILFLEKDVEMARNLKWLLTCFEQMSGMRINYHKSDLLTINVEEDEARVFAQIFGCKLADFPFIYLGVPLHFSKLKKEDLQPILDKIIKRIAGWRGKLLSYKGRLILLQTYVASIPMYLLSFLKFPKWAIKAINSQMAHFFWNNVGDFHKYHLVNWDFVSRKKEYGGLGIQNMRDFNLCLLSSWIRRYHFDNNKIWKMIVDYKYNLSPNIFNAKPVHCSPFRKGVMWAASSARLGTGGKLVMVKKFCFGKIHGLVIVHLLFFFGIYML